VRGLAQFNLNDLQGTLVHRGLLYKNENNTVEAMADYDRALILDNGLAKAYHNRANIKVLLNDLRDVLDDYNMALSLDQDIERTYFNRGVLKFLMGNPEDGCQDLRESQSLGYEEAIHKTNKYCH
jgi:tetratricopeptide (TPR) repeat protein